MKAKEYFEKNLDKRIRFEHGNFAERPLSGTGKELLEMGKYLDDEIEITDEDEYMSTIESLM